MNAKAFEKVNISYSDVAWYKRRWFFGLAFLFFNPVAFMLALNGEVYAESINGGVYRFKGSHLNLVAASLSVFYIFMALVLTGSLD